MNQSPMPSIEKIQRQFPDAVFITPRMIGDHCRIGEHDVRYHCRRLFRHDGHYRFWLNDEPNNNYLTRADLERLIRYISQFGK